MPRNGLPSKYQQIASDIAQRIVNKEFAVGQKVHGRSVLASLYNVSPETIRKAVALLQESDVLMVNKGSGIVINSVDKAYDFIQKFKCIDSVNSLKNELQKLVEQKKQIDEQFSYILDNIIDFSDKLKNLTPYNPIEVEVKKHSKYIGSSIEQLKFWQNTGGTVVALRKDNSIIISPGPLAVLEKGNIIVVVGGENILQDVESFING